MSLLIFALVIVIVVALIVWAIRTIPGLPSPLSWIIQLAVVLVGAAVILMKAGLLGP
jgi:hypothetical protein